MDYYNPFRKHFTSSYKLLPNDSIKDQHVDVFMIRTQRYYFCFAMKPKPITFH